MWFCLAIVLTCASFVQSRVCYDTEQCGDLTVRKLSDIETLIRSIDEKVRSNEPSGVNMVVGRRRRSVDRGNGIASSSKTSGNRDESTKFPDFLLDDIGRNESPRQHLEGKSSFLDLIYLSDEVKKLTKRVKRSDLLKEHLLRIDKELNMLASQTVQTPEAFLQLESVRLLRSVHELLLKLEVLIVDGKPSSSTTTDDAFPDLTSIDDDLKNERLPGNTDSPLINYADTISRIERLIWSMTVFGAFTLVMHVYICFNLLRQQRAAFAVERGYEMN